MYAMEVEALTSKELEALKYIRNRLVHGGISPSVRDVMRHLGYKSPRSAALVVDRLIERGLLRRRPNGNLQLLRMPLAAQDTHRTVAVPLVGTAPCGAPLLATENVEALIPVSQQIARPGHQYFLLRAVGNSMDQRGINDGDLVLVRQQSTAENGETVVALIDDEATIKEFQAGSSAVVLRPRSSDLTHQPIVLTDSFQVQGVVVATIPGID